MKRHIRLGAALAASAALSLAAPAAPALADGFSLQLTPNAQAVVGRSLIIHATGTIPPGDVGFPYYFSLDALPTRLTKVCPSDRWEGVQFAEDNGGSVVVLSQAIRPDATGTFTVPVAITPTAPGTVLLCGYTDDGAALTLASAPLMLNIQSASSAPVRPRQPTPAAYARQGIRACRALLAGPEARSCIRDIVRKANAGCRRLRSRRSEAQCLRDVRRIARRGS
jgi:hypothetical protein